MDKEMLNALSSLLDEKLEPIKSEINTIKLEINTIKSEVKTINSRLDSLEKKVDGIREDLSIVELVTANNYKDIAKLKAIK